MAKLELDCNRET